MREKTKEETERYEEESRVYLEKMKKRLFRKPNRQITQISTVFYDSPDVSQLVVLCDDQTMWSIQAVTAQKIGVWKQLPPIPQDYEGNP